MDNVVVVPKGGTVKLISTKEGWKTLAEPKEILKAETVRVVKKADGAYVLERKIKDSLNNDCWLEARMPVDGLKDFYSKADMLSLFKALEAAQEKAEKQAKALKLGNDILEVLGSYFNDKVLVVSSVGYGFVGGDKVNIKVDAYAILAEGKEPLQTKAEVDNTCNSKSTAPVEATEEQSHQELSDRIMAVVNQYGAAIVKSDRIGIKIEGVCLREARPYGAVKTEKVGNGPKIDLVAEFRHAEAEADDQAEEKQYARLGRFIRQKVDQDGVVTISKQCVSRKLFEPTMTIYQLNTNRGCYTTFGLLHR